MSADRMERSERDPETIRREIRRTRGEMDDTVDELVDRLSVGNLVDEVWQRLRSSGSGGGVGTVLRDHPVPLALMGLGLGWMAVEQATGHSVSPGSERPEGRAGRRTGLAERNVLPRTVHGDAMAHSLESDGHEDGEGVRETMSHATDRMKETVSDVGDRMKGKASHAGDRVKEKASELGHRVAETTSDLSHRASETVSDATSSLEDAGRKARRGMQDILEENPLALGSIVFGLGLASGLSLPSTRFEDRAVGETAENVKKEAKQMAKKGAEKAKEAGKDLAQSAKEAGTRAVGTVMEDTRDTLQETREAMRDKGKTKSGKASERPDGVEETTAPSNPGSTQRTTGMPGTKGRGGSHGTTDSGGFGGTSGGSGRGGL